MADMSLLLQGIAYLHQGDFVWVQLKAKAKNPDRKEPSEQPPKYAIGAPVISVKSQCSNYLIIGNRVNACQSLR